VHIYSGLTYIFYYIPTSFINRFFLSIPSFKGSNIGEIDGGRGGGRCPLKFRKKYFSSNYYVKFGYFSGKNHVKFGHFADF